MIQMQRLVEIQKAIDNEGDKHWEANGKEIARELIDSLMECFRAMSQMLIEKVTE
jgi:hypothetical protein